MCRSAIDGLSFVSKQQPGVALGDGAATCPGNASTLHLRCCQSIVSSLVPDAVHHGPRLNMKGFVDGRHVA